MEDVGLAFIQDVLQLQSLLPSCTLTRNTGKISHWYTTALSGGFLRANRTGSERSKWIKKPESSLGGIILDHTSGMAYFSLKGLKRFLSESRIGYNPNSLKQSLYRLRKDNMIFSAGRGWYSTVSTPYRLDKNR
jgi:hypothetical protein